MICIAGFGIGLVYVTPGGQAILALVDFFGGGFIIFVLAMVEVLAVSWIYGLKRFTSDIKFMLNVSVGIYWKFCWESSFQFHFLESSSTSWRPTPLSPTKASSTPSLQSMQATFSPL